MWKKKPKRWIENFKVIKPKDCKEIDLLDKYGFYVYTQCRLYLDPEYWVLPREDTDLYRDLRIEALSLGYSVHKREVSKHGISFTMEDLAMDLIGFATITNQRDTEQQLRAGMVKKRITALDGLH